MVVLRVVLFVVVEGSGSAKVLRFDGFVGRFEGLEGLGGLLVVVVVDDGSSSSSERKKIESQYLVMLNM